MRHYTFALSIALALSLTGSVPAVAAQDAAPRLMSVRDTQNLVNVGSPAISPDGQWVLYTRAVRDWDDALLAAETPHFFQHLGIYAYRREFLLSLAGLPRCANEQLESLEQLRVLHHGHAIAVGVTHNVSVGIDTPEDYAAFVARRRAG